MTYLDAIVAQRRRDVLSEKRFVPIETLQAMVSERTHHRSLERALHGRRPAIVAEIKRASPSAGTIARRCDPAQIASAFERGGAAALSVLTEPRSFLGSFADLVKARAAVPLPVLCKDFVIDDFQIWKAAAFGADAILLIAAVLEDERLHGFARLATSLGLEAVVEAHTEQEAARALAVGCRIVGANNRDLQNFQVDVETAPRIRASLPDDLLVIAESGYREAEQLDQAARAGIHAFLIGEHLMRAGDPAVALQELCEVHAWSG